MLSIFIKQLCVQCTLAYPEKERTPFHIHETVGKLNYYLLTYPCIQNINKLKHEDHSVFKIR